MPTDKSETAVPIICVPEEGIDTANLSAHHLAWAKANGFSGQQGKLLPLPGDAGTRDGFLFGMGQKSASAQLTTGLASAVLEPGNYVLSGDYGDPLLAGLGFELGAYKFDHYKKDKAATTLQPVPDADQAEISRLSKAAFLARDLINTPANELGPDAFEKWVRKFAKARKMDVSSIVGDDLLSQDFPMIHTVGRASTEAPRLLDLSWGKKSHPKVTLVGKGVTFDTGGLNIKPGAGMALMKKDMGGAANILGLAHAIVDAGLKVRLRVLLPIVENAIAGNAFRPGDVLPSRAGLSVEIGNTDAEGRLILGDALTLADAETPEILIDMATLTGAARVALGPELPPVYSNEDRLAQSLVENGMSLDDPLWHMPLWPGYDRLLSSRIADVNHISPGGFAGSITAALFLQRFVKNTSSWAHLDVFGWAPEARAGRSFGGTDQGIRAAYLTLKQKYT